MWSLNSFCAKSFSTYSACVSQIFYSTELRVAICYWSCFLARSVTELIKATGIELETNYDHLYSYLGNIKKRKRVHLPICCAPVVLFLLGSGFQLSDPDSHFGILAAALVVSCLKDFHRLRPLLLSLRRLGW